MSSRRWALSLLLVLLALCPRIASAHFVLEDPQSWWSQDALGDPQKLGPCGSEGGGHATSAVTAFMTGSTITITIREVIFHPGHYRVSLAVHDRSELPPEPPVTPGSMACGTVPIMDPPVFPVLVDGALVHTSAFSGPQTITVPLPAGVTCDHCTLQVIEFMSNHPLNNPGGCFYHHCADISIQDVVVQNDAGADDAGAMMSVDAGMPMDTGGSSPAARTACGCAVPGAGGTSRSAAWLAGLAALGLFSRRRRHA